MNKLKLISLISIALCLLFIVPTAFAADNQTAISIDESVSDNDLEAKNYYFDINVENDTGDGSKISPYKELNSQRIEEGSVIHLSSGKYNLGTLSRNNLTIIGEGSSKTTLTNGKLTVVNSLTLKDITLKNVTLINNGKITAKNSVINYKNGNYKLGKVEADNLTIKGENALNTILTKGEISVSTSLTIRNIALNKIPITNGGNITARNAIFNSSSSAYGGAINSYDENAYIYINNCTFSNNHATYGGAIYMDGGTLRIYYSLFTNNYATYYGGAITSEEYASITITESKFSNDYSLKDAGGAFYIVDSKISATKLNVINCSATFGGAITSLSSDLKLTNFAGSKNRAKYSGGAIYQMYGTLKLVNSTFTSNSAENGGALFVDDISSFKITSNRFSKNTASNTAGAVYSIISKSLSPISVLTAKYNNTFSKNTASVKNHVYECNLPSLEIGSNSYLLIKLDSSSSKLPAKYDLRKLNQVTSVKNQGKGGNCWAFAALGSLESCILKATGTSYDLSEENMKNLMSLYSDYGWDMDPNEGGYDKMAVGYLTSWLGPVKETSDQYCGLSSLSPVLKSLVHIQEIKYLKRTSYTDNNYIKNAIINYGAVSTSIYWSSSYIKNTKNYYYSGSSSANHAVCIVGWDDSYSRYNFGKTPKGDGAWIIKNSWGTGSGDNGYYYVSYYDTKLAPLNKTESTYVFVLNDTFKYDKSYQYDIPGKTDYFINSSSSVWYKNKFTSTANEYLAAVSTYFEKDTSWDLSIYVNNNLKLTQSGKSHASYSTIQLDKLLLLKKGDVFEVVFKITVDKEAGVPISEDISLNKLLYKKGISYISYNGKKWIDFFDLSGKYSTHTYYSQVACIKAFTTLTKTATTLNLKVDSSINPVVITATVYNRYGGLVKSGKVVFNVEGKNYSVNIKDGVSKFTYVFSTAKSKVVNATFSATGFKVSTSKISVKPTLTSINTKDMVRYHGRTFKYSATLLDSNGSAVKNKELKFSIGNKNYLATTNKNGVASVTLTLKTGTYDVVTGFNDLSGCSKFDSENTITIKSTVIIPCETKYAFNSKYPITLVDSYAQKLKDYEFELSIDGIMDVVSTDSNGKLNYYITLDPGTHKVSITNPVTNETVSKNINVVSRITKNNDLTMYYGAGSSYKVKVVDDNGKICENLKVTFAVNGKTYYRYTDASGYASLKIGLKPKAYTITASYKGFEVSNKITVKSTIVTKDIEVKRGKTIKFTAKLLDSKGKILKYKQVTFKFKGKTYKIKTNSYGIATLKVTKRYALGKYTITSTYGSLSIKNTIKIKK